MPGTKEVAEVSTAPHDVRRRLALHQSVIDHLNNLPDETWRPKALENIQKSRAHASGLALAVLDEWETLLRAGTLNSIREACERRDEHGDLLRVMSPFAGILPETTRRAVLAAHPHT